MADVRCRDRKLRKGITGKTIKSRLAILLTVLSVVLQGSAVYATAEGTTAAEGTAAAEEPAATGPDWAMDAAAAPAVVAEGAILMDIDTGVIFYEKNIHERYYPASITKLLTCLVAAENSELTDIVTFSHLAVFGIERGSSHIGIDEGEQLTMKDCYYGALLASANEVSSGMAEHVGGSIEGFAAMMNEKVEELGGCDSHFVNANGLHDDNHYTSAYDMALIGQAFARNDMLLEISGTAYYHIDATPAQPDDIALRHHHRMLPGCQLSRAKPYEYMIGGKNGFTSVARTTLVTFAKKDGHRLVCVLLKDENPHHYSDTLALFEYGFACYENPALRSQIDAKILEIQAKQNTQEKTSAEEETVAAAGEAVAVLNNTDSGLMPEEPDSLTDSEGNRSEAGAKKAADLKKADGNKSNDAEKGGFSILTVLVIVVVLAAVSVCGAIFYRSYKQEQERKRRRAEIMARHRARRQEA